MSLLLRMPDTKPLPERRQAPRTAFAIASAIAAGVFCSACISSDTVVHVRPDGTGRIEQTILVNRQSFETLAGVAGQMAGSTGPAAGAAPSLNDLFDEAKLREAAAHYGSGVEYVSSERVKRGEMEGSHAIFSFTDVSKLNVAQSPQQAGVKDNDVVTMRLDRGPDGNSVLIVTMPDRREAGSTAAPPAATPESVPPEALAMIKPFLQGLHVGIDIDVEGTIVRTNAEHVSGSKVTLLAFDVDPALNNVGVIEALSRLHPGMNASAMQAIMKDVPGFVMNTSSSLMIQFK